MELERRWADQTEPHENVDTKDTVHMQLFYGQSKELKA